MKCERIWTVSNILSVTRIGLVGPIILALLQNSSGSNIAAGALILAAAATDFLDGLLARRLGQISEFGKLIDPLADKLAVAGVAAVLVFLGRIPSWFLIFAAGRDLLILCGGAWARRATGVTLESMSAGKWAVGV